MLTLKDFEYQSIITDSDAIASKIKFFFAYIIIETSHNSELLRLKLVSITEKDFYKYKILEEETKERFPTVKLSSGSKFLFFESLKEYYIKQC